MTVDHTQVRLGKQARKDDVRTLKLSKYLAPAPPPVAVDWLTKVETWPMMANDAVGCCTITAQGHCVEQWTDYATGTPGIVSDADILAAYSAVSGYDPAQTQPDGSNPTDVGATCLDALKHWRSTGVGGHKSELFVEVDHNNLDEVRRAIQLFGNVYLGVQLPISAQSQASWDVVGDGASGDAQPGSWGGHCVPGGSYDATGITVVTWGELVPMTWGFFSTYVDECYAVVSTDWLNGENVDPSGLNLAQLEADLDNIANPPDAPSPGPAPTPDPGPAPDPSPAQPPVPDPAPAPAPAPGPDPTVIADDLANVEADREQLDADLDQLESDEGNGA